MKTALLALAGMIGSLVVGMAADPGPAGTGSEGDPSPPLLRTSEGERDGSAAVLHRDEVLHDRGRGRHLWPLLAAPEARINYFEVTGRGPLHFHPDADHRLYVLEGPVLVTCGAKTITCNAGDFIVIPKGVRHCYDVPAKGGRALLLTFDAPPYDPQKTVNVEPAATPAAVESASPAKEPSPPK